jgi:hypothetical protein
MESRPRKKEKKSAGDTARQPARTALLKKKGGIVKSPLFQAA